VWTREAEDGVLPACRELGIGFVAYSPLGRGFLTGQLKRFEDFAADDYRRLSPRFQGENFNKNLAVIGRLGEMAKDKKCTPGQLALAWVLAQGNDIVPIPGTKRIRYLAENLGALDVQLTAAECAAISAIFPADSIAGTRYPPAMMAALGR
jgi:aryl-alcohol dehydrogenase-like predicted oxidoreductase